MKTTNKIIVGHCWSLLEAYKSGSLGDTTMPEDFHPHFPNDEIRLAYFTLPMALNYQRDSYKLWQAALATFGDDDTSDVFAIGKVAKMDDNMLRQKLLKYKLALQPNKHIDTWKRVSCALFTRWQTINNFMEAHDRDYLKIRECIQQRYKQDFPYLSGPKIFNYWIFIISTYGGVNLLHPESIEIAPDTHITKCSVKLGVISESEATNLTKDQISARWRKVLQGSGIIPIEMHPPLWFWSRNGFKYSLK